jgi:hypothetical protein
MTLLSRTRSGLHRRLLPSPVDARHAEYSMLYSEDDAFSRPSERLFEISLEAIRCARRILLDEVCHRLRGRFPYADDLVNVWPGEHYRLLAAMVQILQPKLVIEIGTGEGLSALSMMKYLAADANLVTFDLIPWPKYPRRCLSARDFQDGRLRQFVGDLGQPEIFDEHRELLNRADFIVMDAAKDGLFEGRLLKEFEERSNLNNLNNPVFLLDDIRLWNMLTTWRELRWPKLDITSFGHWCGTGICELPIRPFKDERSYANER